VADVRAIPRKRAATRPKLVHQFLVVLSGTDPLVWRRIQVPERYSFWDLHVAIQDAMGWLDYHLHEFRLLDAAERRVVSIGIPTDDDPENDLSCVAEKSLSTFFNRRGWQSRQRCMYMPSVTTGNTCSHEGFESADDNRSCPRCVAGDRPVSARGCGGIHGYAEFLQIIAALPS
jgi:hypothetical protein